MGSSEAGRFMHQPQAMDARLLLEGRALENRYRLGWWDALIVVATALP
jgi:predicted nucleic acid-binding protein